MATVLRLKNLLIRLKNEDADYGMVFKTINNPVGKKYNFYLSFSASNTIFSVFKKHNEHI